MAKKLKPPQQMPQLRMASTFTMASEGAAGGLRGVDTEQCTHQCHAAATDGSLLIMYVGHAAALACPRPPTAKTVVCARRFSRAATMSSVYRRALQRRRVQQVLGGIHEAASMCK